MDQLYLGRGNSEQFDEYMDFINYVFGFNGNENDFKKLLPKLYREDLNPAGNSYIAMENGKMKAAIGAFPGEVEVCGMKLRHVGIGNVAVHPYSRSKGYMKKLLHMAVDDMVKEGIDFSALGGHRQRYNYFSYEKAGLKYIFGVDSKNIRHVFGDKKPPFQVEEVTKEDKAALDVIEKISSSKSYNSFRKKEELYNILCNWQHKPYIFKDGENIIGYCIVGGDSVTEILTIKNEDFLGAAWSLVAMKHSVSFAIPEFQSSYIDDLDTIANGGSVQHSAMFTVLCYKREIEAFLCLKAEYTQLPEGEFTVLIHGRGGDETLLIAVKDGNITVEETDAMPEMELEHLEAMRFFFALVCEKRRKMPHYIQCWFPLPLWEYSADAV